MVRKKIAYITNNIAPFRVMLLDELARHAEVTLFYVHEIEAGVKAEYVKMRPKRAHLQSISELGLKGTFQRLKEMDMVFFDGYSGREKLRLMSRMWLAGLPYAISIDGVIDRGGSSFKQKLLDRVKSFALGHAAFVLSTNQPTDAYIHRLAPKARIKRHIFSTLSEEDFQKMVKVDADAVFAKHGIQKAEKNLLFVGKFLKEKGVLELLDGLRQMDDSDLQLIMVGGSKEELLSMGATIPSNLHIIPFLEKPDILELMRAADVFALPTHSDTWGLVIVEALSAGIPIVSTNRCNAALEFIQDGQNGYLMQDLTADEFAKKLAMTLELDTVQLAAYDQELMQGYHLEGSAKNLMKILEEEHV